MGSEMFIFSFIVFFVCVFLSWSHQYILYVILLKFIYLFIWFKLLIQHKFISFFIVWREVEIWLFPSLHVDSQLFLHHSLNSLSFAHKFVAYYIWSHRETWIYFKGIYSILLLCFICLSFQLCTLFNLCSFIVIPDKS